VAKLQSPLVANSQTRQRYSDIEEVEIARMGGVHAGCPLFPLHLYPSDTTRERTGRDRAVATQLMTQVFPLCRVDCLGASRGYALRAEIPGSSSQCHSSLEQQAPIPRASCSVYPSSVTGKARSPSAIGKLFGVQQMIALLAIRDLPTTLRAKSRFTASLAAGPI
jgi:hypothetical protein